MYSTYEFYRDTYRGQLGEDGYNRLAPLAKAQIDYYTLGRAVTAPDSMAEPLALTECMLIDKLYSFGTVTESGGITGVSSVNNDGFSISFSSDTRSSQANELWDIIRMGLMFPVNLVSRAVRVRNVQTQSDYCWGWPPW